MQTRSGDSRSRIVPQQSPTQPFEKLVDFTLLECADLRAELQNRGLPLGGTKKSLVLRLQRSDGAAIRGELRNRGLPVKGNKRWCIRQLQWSDYHLRQNPTTWRHRPIPYLQAECRRRGLSTKGRNHRTLYYRLEVSDRKLEEARQGISPIQILFPQFSRLPIEIRNMIWAFACPPRAIPVDINQDMTLFIPIEYRPANPIALRVCSESREWALRRYQSFLGWDDVYVDFHHGDYLYFGSCCKSHSKVLDFARAATLDSSGTSAMNRRISDFAQVKLIAWNFDIWSRFTSYMHGEISPKESCERWLDSVLGIIRVFENLQEIALVVREENTRHPRGYENDPEFFMRDSPSLGCERVKALELAALLSGSKYLDKGGVLKQFPEVRVVDIEVKRRQ